MNKTGNKNGQNYEQTNITKNLSVQSILKSIKMVESVETVETKEN